MAARKKPEKSAASKRRGALSDLAKKFASYTPASQALTYVTSVPTVFPQMDSALHVGGLPLQRVIVVHGPSHGGKTRLVLALIKSFLMKQHFAQFIDAERATPQDFLQAELGEYANDQIRFKAARPDTFEEAVLLGRRWLKSIEEARNEGLIDKQTCAIFAVDSLRKLTPQGEFEMLSNDKEAIAGRAGQRRASMNASWLDELVPLLERANAVAVLIARETENPNAQPWEVKAGLNYKIGGGKAVIYDASLLMRVERQTWIKRGEVIVGERHKVTVTKNKISAKNGKNTVWYFHTSNGTDCPAGHDMLRDTYELGEQTGIVQMSGTRPGYQGKTYAGKEAMIAALRKDPELEAKFNDEVRGFIADRKPVLHDEDGVILDDA